MRFHKQSLMAASALAGLMALSAEGAANAQPAVSSGDEVIVTGSRIPKSNFSSSAPITVITSDTASLQGLADVSTLLQTSPIASGSFQVNGLLSGYVVTGGPGVETISLRGLGPQRSLVLLNGRRLGPAGVRGTVGPVDLNIIPDPILDRIDILEDGASSIYGSDAVAGVVNFITKKTKDGGLISVYGNGSQKGGGGKYEVDGTWGKTFDRGYVSITGVYSEQQELTLGQRKFTSCATDRVTDPSTGASLDYIDPLTGKTKCWNVLTNVAEASAVYGGVFQYAVPGVTYPTAAQGNNVDAIFPGFGLGTGPGEAGFVRAARSGRPVTMPYANYDTPLYARSSAVSPYQRASLFVSGGYDLTPKTEMYTEVLVNQRKSQQHGLQQLFPDVSVNNPNNPFPLDFLPIVAFKNDQQQTVNYGRAVLGFKGTLPASLPVVHGWKWDAYGQISDSHGTYTTDFIHNDRMNAVTGDLACDSAQITISGPAACPNGGAGIPWFSQRVLAGNFNASESAFLFAKATGKTDYLQQAIEATASGDLFNVPAGPVAASVGFTVRHDSIDDEPSYEERNANLYNLSAATPTKGDDTVKEVFGELNVPIFRALPFVKALTGELSGRYTDYRSYGSNGTYKVGLDWQINSWFRLRGTLGTSFRAPSLYELYLGSQTSFIGQTGIDPCINYQNSSNSVLQANCAAAGIPTAYLGGGSGATITASGGKGRLKAETSLADTLSIVFTPSFADLSIAVDYFDITVSNEIRQLGAGNLVSGCYTSTIYPADPLCSLLHRDAVTHAILTVNDNYINVAEEVNRGIDLSVRYARKVGQTKFAVDGKLTWQFQDRTQLLRGSVPEDYNGTTAEPAFTGQVQLRADRGDWTVFWNVDLYGKASDTGLLGFQYTDVHFSGRYNQPVKYNQQTEFTAYHDVTVRRKFDKWVIEGGVQNLFDEAPPALSGNEGFRAGYSALNAYDLIGRRFFLQVDRKF